MEQYEQLRERTEAAFQHALRHWKENGSKADDQLGVVALMLAYALGKIEEAK